MTEIIDDILLDDIDVNEIDDPKKLKLIELVKDGSIKKYVGKNLTEEKVNKLDESDIEQYYKLYLEKYNNELRKPIANSILNIYAHTVNRFRKIDSVEGLTNDLVKDPAIEAAFNRLPNEIISSLSIILAPIMLVSHTYNHVVEETNNENNSENH